MESSAQHSVSRPDEYSAAKTGCALLDQSGRTTLRVTGEDRVTFIHGMVTNDISGLAEGASTYAALLTAKGAMVSDARILRRKDDLLIDVEPGFGPPVLEFLNKYLISEDAAVQDVTSEFNRLTLVGPKSAELLSTLKDALPSAIALPPAAPLSIPSFDLLEPRSAAEAVEPKVQAAITQFGLHKMGLATFEVLRIEHGTPRFGRDMDAQTIPLEANLERALHYNKGCYIGQEVIARATFRGHMNRKLVGILLGDATPDPKTELRMGDRKVGWITSVATSPLAGQNIGLGYLHRDHLTPGTQIVVGATGKNAEVSPLPFLVR